MSRSTKSVASQLLSELLSNPELSCQLRDHFTKQHETANVEAQTAPINSPPAAPEPEAASGSGTQRGRSRSRSRPQSRGRKRRRTHRQRDRQPSPQSSPSSSRSASPVPLMSDSSEDSDSGDTDLGFFNTKDMSITAKMKAKILNREYVDFAKLYFGSSSESVKTTVTSKTSTTTSVHKKPSKDINNILTWSRAFQLYASVYCQKYPEEAPGMFQYLSLVQSLALKVDNWLSYDTKFRSLRATSALPWHKVHTETYLHISINSVQPSQSTQRSSRPWAKARPKPAHNGPSPFRDGYCWVYQRSGRCPKPACPHTHRCSFCGQSHAALRCHSKQQARHTSGTTHTASGSSAPKS